jgi:DNA processing protein
MALARVPGIGVVYAKKLITVFGEAIEIFKASQQQLAAAGLPEAQARAIVEFDAWEPLKAEAALLAAKDIRILYFTDPDYPGRLLSLSNAPPVLYYRGKADLNAKKTIAVVGTRFADDYGRHTAQRLIAQLQPAAPLVISGLARGIDAAAHRAALDNDLPTVGVLAHGLATLYPQENKRLSEIMVEKGGLLTSYAYAVKAERFYFPERNWLVAALADALIVVETGLEGGSMVTVGHARSLGRPIFAVPGRLGDRSSEGCNRLIQQGVARLLSSGQQLAAEMGWTWPAGGVGVQAEMSFETAGVSSETEGVSSVSAGVSSGTVGASFRNAGARAEIAGADSPEGRLVRLIREKESPGIDELILCSGLDASVVALALLQLELRGAITVLPGKRYAMSCRG